MSTNRDFCCLLLILLSSSTYAEVSSPASTAAYATKNYNRTYGGLSTQNPFPNVSEVGGNCTNFANQSISGGLLALTDSKLLNSTLTRIPTKFPSTVDSKWFYKCNNSVTGNICQSPTWRGAQNMFTFSGGGLSVTNPKGLRMGYVTKTALVGGSLQPLNHKAVKVGDLIYADFNFRVGGPNSVDHTMVVTKRDPDSIFDILLRQKYNRIRLTYQSTGSLLSTGKTNIGLGDILCPSLFSSCGTFAFYTYRPSGYFR